MASVADRVGGDGDRGTPPPEAAERTLHHPPHGSPIGAPPPTADGTPGFAAEVTPAPEGQEIYTLTMSERLDPFNLSPPQRRVDLVGSDTSKRAPSLLLPRHPGVRTNDRSPNLLQVIRKLQADPASLSARVRPLTLPFTTAGAATGVAGTAVTFTATHVVHLTLVAVQMLAGTGAGTVTEARLSEPTSPSPAPPPRPRPAAANS